MEGEVKLEIVLVLEVNIFFLVVEEKENTGGRWRWEDFLCEESLSQRASIIFQWVSVIYQILKYIVSSMPSHWLLSGVGVYKIWWIDRFAISKEFRKNKSRFFLLSARVLDLVFYIRRGQKIWIGITDKWWFRITLTK